MTQNEVRTFKNSSVLKDIMMYDKSKNQVEQSPSSLLFKRDVNLEKRLGTLFLEVAKGKRTLSTLSEAAESIRRELVQRDSQGWDDRFSYLLLKDALEEIDTFHDDFTRSHYELHPESLISYAEKLLGMREATFTIGLPGKIKVNITYLPQTTSE